MKAQMTRRDALAALGSAGLGGLLVGCGNDDDAGADGASATTTQATTGRASSGLAALFDEANTCSVTPEETEGPYYIDVDSIRSDIRDGRPGTDLRVAVRLLDEGCAPIPDAVVELWHCDGLGTYSGFEPQSRAANDPGGGASGSGASGDTSDTGSGRFLRGGQVTDRDGIAEITTVYPGWYQGRTVHIHAKVHVNNHEMLTTQLYFDDAVSDELYASAEPYKQRADRDVRNGDDRIFHEQNLLTLSKEGDGYLGIITLTVSRA